MQLACALERSRSGTPRRREWRRARGRPPAERRSRPATSRHKFPPDAYGKACRGHLRRRLHGLYRRSSNRFSAATPTASGCWLLLARGADPNADRSHALRVAAADGSVLLLRLLLDAAAAAKRTRWLAARARCRRRPPRSSSPPARARCSTRRAERRSDAPCDTFCSPRHRAAAAAARGRSGAWPTTTPRCARAPCSARGAPSALSCCADGVGPVTSSVLAALGRAPALGAARRPARGR